METWNPDWQRFETMDAATWEGLIARELKGGDPESLLWPIEPGITGRPFYLSAGADVPGPLAGHASTGWQILEEIPVSGDAVQANTLALEALTQGAEAIHFTEVRPEQVARLLDGILPEVAPVYWTPAADIPPDRILEALSAFMDGDGVWRDSANITGGWLSVLPDGQPVIPARGFLRWEILHAESGPSALPAAQLSENLQRIHQAVEMDPGLRNAGYPAVIRLEIGDQLLTEVARLRAWRILWAHYLASWGLTDAWPCRVHARVRCGDAQPWEDTMIAATTRGLAAVLGGADLISILPPGQAPAPTARRLARNVQHLMREEARLHLVRDPMAGSYAVESLSHQIAGSAWDRFSP